MFDNSNKKSFNPLKILGYAVFAIGLIFLVGFVVMLLWNAILPDILNAKPLNIWQAIGLLILSKILFGGMRWGGRGKGGYGPSKRKQWKEKWMNMTPEEREAMKEKWKNRCKK